MYRPHPVQLSLRKHREGQLKGLADWRRKEAGLYFLFQGVAHFSGGGIVRELSDWTRRYVGCDMHTDKDEEQFDLLLCSWIIILYHCDNSTICHFVCEAHHSVHKCSSGLNKSYKTLTAK
jgi:hypothetical protein